MEKYKDIRVDDEETHEQVTWPLLPGNAPETYTLRQHVPLGSLSFIGRKPCMCPQKDISRLKCFSLVAFVVFARESYCYLLMSAVVRCRKVCG